MVRTGHTDVGRSPIGFCRETITGTRWRHRAGEADPHIAEGIQLSINAIATALQNSG